MGFGLGIDTGGTHTDAVILDFATGDILCKTKSQTTHGDLSEGIDAAINGLNGGLLGNVTMVSLSSTLATNSIVEGRGGRVGFVGIGLEFSRAVPVEASCTVGGRHDIYGKQDEPLDESAVRAFLEEAKGKVDALAVSGYLGVRNSWHERRVKTLSDEILGVPVVCGHQLSTDLGFDERATTAIMNARLLPVISGLIGSVKESLSRAGIDAPFMVVRGDGSLMSEPTALDRPIETIISGPAASLIGARALTGRDDAIVIDMGGTTTDIGVLRGGRPRLVEEGATIGGRRTKVLAASVSTTGIGGDSRIVANGPELTVGPRRAIPLCVAAARWPTVKESLAETLAKGPKKIRKARNLSYVVLDCEFFVSHGIADPRRHNLGPNSLKLIELASAGPVSLRAAEAATGIHPLSFGDATLEALGLVERIGFTPTDVVHALGEYGEHDAEASMLGAEYLSGIMGMDVDGFLVRTKRAVVDRLAATLLRDLATEETGHWNPSRHDSDFLAKAISGEFGKDYGCFVRFNKPIVGIGAPVGAYLPAVAAKFDAELLLPRETDVGNAVGAITGSIVETVRIVVRPTGDGADHEESGAILMSPFERKEFSRFGAAVEHARKMASAKAVEAAIAQGAVDPGVTVGREDHWLGDREGGILVETTVVATAMGKPRFA
ncbi:MAG: hydantoinase/oxoprolinase family protein [Thermoplasmatales archaeon]|nr:hydantoinase/oxoprolinase family protein [Thermoplasmatales archaeon]